jgi:hypothetical protein
MNIAFVEPRPFGEALVEIAGKPLGGHEPDQRRHRIDDQPQFRFPLTGCFVRFHLVMDVEADAVPLNDLTVSVSQWFGLAVDPAIDAIEAPLPVFQREALASFKGLRQAPLE